MRRLASHHAFTHADGLVLRATSLPALKATKGTNWPLSAREALFSLALFIVITKSGETFLVSVLRSLGLCGVLVLDLLPKLQHGIWNAQCRDIYSQSVQIGLHDVECFERCHSRQWL